jgi:DNA-3-methyladenine glycosylase II
MPYYRTSKLPYDTEIARKHLMRADPTLGALVKQIGPADLRRRGTPYQSLFRALLYQQLAGAAAATIERRLLALFDNHVPEPEVLFATDIDKLRSVGLSRQKASYMHSLAEHFANGAVSNRALGRMSDEAVIDHVTQIKGIGTWTAHMLLMFSLGRPDVLPTGDLGVQKAIEELYRLTKAPDPKTMLEIGEPWRPYRTVASWYLWRSRDTLTL